MDPELKPLVANTWGIIALAAGLGVIVLAVQKLLQHFLALREKFQRREIPRIVERLAKDINARMRIVDSGSGDAYAFDRVVRSTGEVANLPQIRAVDPKRALANLVQLATAGQADVLYNLPIDQLAGQLSVAAQSVLDFPRNNPDLLLLLSSGAEAADLITILSPPPQPAPASMNVPAPPSPQAIEYIDARNRVAHQVQRNLDALQIHMRYWLQLYLQLWAIVFGLASALLLVWLSAGNPFYSWPLLRLWIICGVIAGFFSTIFSNTLDALLARRGGN